MTAAKTTGCISCLFVLKSYGVVLWVWNMRVMRLADGKLRVGHRTQCSYIPLSDTKKCVRLVKIIKMALYNYSVELQTHVEYQKTYCT